MTATDTDAGSEELFLPEPLPREVKYTVISVDDHVVEPPHTFEGRLPAHLQDRAPKVVDTPQGLQIWEFEGEKFTQVGMNAVAGRRAHAEDGAVPLRPDAPELLRRRRPRARHGHQRRVGGGELPVDDHAASAAGCSSTPRTPSSARRASGRGTTGCTRSGTSAHPTRIVPLGIAFLSDPEAAVAEIHRNAERGFTGISMPERPHLIGLPDLWQRDHWDPIIQACVDTDTVVSLHVGSSGGADGPGERAAPAARAPRCSASCRSRRAAEWLWSEYPREAPGRSRSR